MNEETRRALELMRVRGDELLRAYPEGRVLLHAALDSYLDADADPRARLAAGENYTTWADRHGVEGPDIDDNGDEWLDFRAWYNAQ